MPSCYICGSRDASSPLAIKKTFTAHSRCKNPESDKLCQRCFDCLDGKYKQCWYYHPTKEKWAKLWGRNWSWLVSRDEKNCFPKFRVLNNSDLLEVYEIPSRRLIRKWIVSPPHPPFTISLADSGQKHIYPFSSEAKSKSLFPVLLEETLIYVRHQEFTELLKIFEALLGLGFSKAEILSGEYRSGRIIKCLHLFVLLEDKIKSYRRSSLLDLVNFVGQKP